MKPKNRIAYIILGVFLGYLGVHNFYAGYKKTAVIQLLVSVLSLFILSPVSAIWALFEVCTVKADPNGVPFEI